MEPPLVVPVVLAAGASQRMGEPKALLDFGGRTALARIVGTCRDAGVADPLVVVGHDSDRVVPEAERLGCAVVVNLDPDQGQGSSLQAGVGALPDEAAAFLIWPVDAPRVSPGTVRALVEAWDASGRPGIAVPRHAGRRGHPALVAAPLAEEFLALDPGRPAHEVIRRDPARVREVDVRDAAVLDRLDSPSDYEAALRADREGN